MRGAPNGVLLKVWRRVYVVRYWLTFCLKGQDFADLSVALGFIGLTKKRDCAVLASERCDVPDVFSSNNIYPFF